MTAGRQSPEARDAMEIARAVAAEAAEGLRGVSGSTARTWTKGSFRDLVTEWDTRTEALIRRELERRAPGIPMLGEEGGAGEDDGDAGEADGPELRWLVDPIDGTVNFSHGLPLWSISIALERRGRPIAGVVRAPALGWEFYGSRGGGAFQGGERLEVSRVDALAQAMLVTGFPYDLATRPDNNFAEWAHMQRTAGACRRLGAASLDLCMVARGWIDGYWERNLHAWDLAAGALLIEEAGGRATDFEGAPYRLADGLLVASNGHIHDELLSELSRAR